MFFCYFLKDGYTRKPVALSNDLHTGSINDLNSNAGSSNNRIIENEKTLKTQDNFIDFGSDLDKNEQDELDQLLLGIDLSLRPFQFTVYN